MNKVPICLYIMKCDGASISFHPIKITAEEKETSNNSSNNYSQFNIIHP